MITPCAFRPHKSIFALITALVIALVAAVGVAPTPAYAYFNFGTVQVSTGSSSISLSPGDTVSTSIALSPSSDSQTLGCGMAKCPQVCESEGAVAAGYTCFDVNGNCTCAGPDYSTYYTTVSASSSNNGVASAYVSGNTLIISGVSAGEATITLTGELRQWTTGSTQVYVQVGGDSSNSSSNSSSGSSSRISTTVVTPEAATADGADTVTEQIIETTAGTVHKVAISSSTNTKSTLSALTEDGDQAIFYSGNADSPDYSWTFVRSGLTSDAATLEFDPHITVSDLGTGMVANLLKQSDDGLVLDFVYSGTLPGSARIDVKVSGTYPDGTVLKLFLYDEENYRFQSADQEITVSGGYASFTIDHCSTWALSKTDLSSLTVTETNTPGARQSAGTSSSDESTGGANASSADGATTTDDTPIVPIVIALAVVVIIVVAVCLIVSRRKAAAQRSELESTTTDAADAASDSTPEPASSAESAPTTEEKHD